MRWTWENWAYVHIKYDWIFIIWSLTYYLNTISNIVSSDSAVNNGESNTIYRTWTAYTEREISAII